MLVFSKQHATMNSYGDMEFTNLFSAPSSRLRQSDRNLSNFELTLSDLLMFAEDESQAKS